jgi:tRNA threonylcarbamoyladenosine biosynthesis protein TsaB
MTMDQLTVLGVAIGPGSFTSLRVGLALVKGLALAGQIPLIGIPTLDILTHPQPVGEYPLGVAIQAGRGRFALGWYQGVRSQWQARGEARVVTLEALKEEVMHPSVICGEFTAADRQTLLENANVQLAAPADSIRRPAVLAGLAWARFQTGDVDDAASLAPIYLHTAAPIGT